MTEEPIPPSVETVVELPRGGRYVRTRAGGVQLAIPPETIKDVLGLGLELPILYVVPTPMFDFRRGMSVAEAEFPAYFSFFLRGRRIRIAVRGADEEARLRRTFEESLLGPAARRSSTAPEEYAETFPLAARPDFGKECESFRRLPDGRRLDVDLLVEFVRFERDPESDVGRIDLGGGVEVVSDDRAQLVEVRQDGVVLASLAQACTLPERSAPGSDPRSSRAVFHPPAFGVTVLGASHGFDPSGKTTGFLLWLGGRGVLIDPPVDTMDILREGGVTDAQIDGVILTHCHADHDAGTLQKILSERRVNLYTTPTVLGSFLRKYSAITGIGEDVLRRTFVYCPVTIGAALRVGSAELVFFYNLHSIPALGLEAFYGGKSLVVSGDSLYDPERIQELAQRGVLSSERAERLLGFPFHHTLVLHEAGVPPIHTPTRVLADLPDDVKQRLYLVHIAERDVPAGAGLRVAPVGLESTLRIDVSPPRFADAIEVLEAFSACELFHDLPIARAKEVLGFAKVRQAARGDTIIRAGEPGREFFVVVSGTVAVTRGGATLRTYGAGDFFGETAILRGRPRNADVVARTDVDLLEFDQHAFSYLARGTEIWRRLERLARMREESSWEVFGANSVLRALTSSQKTQLQSLLEVRDVRAGETLWHAGDRATEAFIVDDAILALEAGGRELEPFRRGAFVGEFESLVQAGPEPTEPAVLTTSLRARGAGRTFRIAAHDLARFFSQNPRVLLCFAGCRFVE